MEYDAVVVGAGPNGLAAAITLAQAGQKVLVLEAAATIGGGTRTQELTLPGFKHDICSAIHPLGLASPFFRRMPLEKYGLEWLQPPVAVAHPLDGGKAAALYQSIAATAAELGQDGATYQKLMQPIVRDWQKLLDAFLGPLRLPQHPVAMARFGLNAIRSVKGLNHRFETEQAKALIAGMGAHSILPLERPPSAAFALVLGLLGHAVGWPIPKGGSQQITNAMAAYLQDLGGEIQTGVVVTALEKLPPAKAILLNLTPRQIIKLAARQLPPLYVKRLEHYRYGSGVFKLDIALDGAIPWQAAACRQAGTVHVGGTFAEIAEAEKAVWRGQIPAKPFVLLAQQSLFDPTRAPTGKHTVWAYCHVPHGSSEDMTERIETQIERFAPGFRARILARHTFSAPQMEEYNANYVGGDINGGVQDFGQLFTRPVIRPNPYRTPLKNLFICSSATPPGGGVHGMSGYYAAKSFLKG